MACDFSQFKKFADGLQRLEKTEMELFVQSCTRELAARLLAKVIKRTPVGDYKDGKMGGTLRRGWTASSSREAELTATFGGGAGGAAYAKSLDISKIPGGYQIIVKNTVDYASYAEYGHRTRGGKGWVNGQFFLTISEQELDRESQSILERKIDKKLREVFGGA